MKALQYFSREYLKQCRDLTTDEILKFLEDFRNLHSRKTGTKLISLKVANSLLETFKTTARLRGVRYQTQIKTLMKDWVSGEGRF